ncbi:hypothetical protein [Desulfogranum japonicum]|uniref:hypothetical protein n=1 Tax=Desulfogranum japonicum TaxID=231447 RepID=UPI00042687A0|nr:hypothetical protein [Desulfogranum japonicum]
MHSLLMKIVASCIGCILFAGLAYGSGITGNWNFSISNSKVEGFCPMGGNTSGTLAIFDKGKGKYVLKFVSGMSCSPPRVCILKGTCSGTDCTFSTTVPVDNQGGKVTNSAKLHFSGNSASGTGKSIYQQSGMRCTWSYALKLSK